MLEQPCQRGEGPLRVEKIRPLLLLLPRRHSQSQSRLPWLGQQRARLPGGMLLLLPRLPHQLQLECHDLSAAGEGVEGLRGEREGEGDGIFEETFDLKREFEIAPQTTERERVREEEKWGDAARGVS